MGDLYALFPDEEITLEVGHRWPGLWPDGGGPGIYFVFGSEGQLLCVSKASMNSSMGARLSHWFKMERPSGRCAVVHGWTERPAYIATLPIPADLTFEAPAIEEYLIGRLNPPDNGGARRMRSS
jgi:excinuclease UvrABC nuclease subunit